MHAIGLTMTPCNLPPSLRWQNCTQILNCVSQLKTFFSAIGSAQQRGSAAARQHGSNKTEQCLVLIIKAVHPPCPRIRLHRSYQQVRVRTLVGKVFVLELEPSATMKQTKVIPNP